MAHEQHPIKVDMDFADGKDHSAVMEMAFADAGSGKHMRVALCAALYLVLAVIWAPGFSFNSKVFTATTEEHKPQKRKVLKPPPEQPLERVQTQERKTKKTPMPDLTPDEPEPVVEPDPPPEPEVLPTDDWEIGIPDGPPVQEVDTIARVGQVGVEPPVFTKRVSPK